MLGTADFHKDGIENCTEALLRRGIDPAWMVRLGSGSYATAYRLRDGRVLKVTEDESDIGLSEWIRDQRHLPPMFPRIDLVFHPLPCAMDGDGEAQGIIVREDIEDYLDRAPFGSSYRAYMAELLPCLSRVLNSMFPHETEYRKEVLTKDLEDYLNVLERDRNFTNIYGPDWADNVRRGVEYCHRNHITINDVRLPNVGIRPGTMDFVIRDLGVSQTPGTGSHDPLAGVRRGRRSGLRLTARR
jgi:hypothetical protein